MHLFKCRFSFLIGQVKNLSSAPPKTVRVNFLVKGEFLGPTSTMFIPVGYDTVCEIATFHNNYVRGITCGINSMDNKEQQYRLK